MSAPTPPKKKHPLEQKALDRLDHLRITPAQARAAGALSSVGTTSGSLVGAALGTGIGLAVKKPATGAGLGAGIGGALGGGVGAGAGLYSGRPKKKRDGDGDGVLNEAKVKKSDRRKTGGAMAGAGLASGGVGHAGYRVYRHGQELQRHGVTVAENEAKIQVARVGQGLSERIGHKPESEHWQRYARAAKQANGAIQDSAKAVARSKTRTGRSFLTAGALTVAGAGVAAHTAQPKKISKADARDAATGAAGLASAGGAVHTGRKVPKLRQQGAFWKESAAESAGDASQASKLARANGTFAESAASAADTADRQPHYLAQSRAWSLRAKTFAGHAQTEGKRAQKMLAGARRNGAAAGVLAAGALGSGGALAARDRERVGKAYDETKHRRDRGRFAPKSGMTEAPGSAKPAMSGDRKKQLVANTVAGLGVAGSVADAAALKAGWAESKNATKKRVTVRRIKDTSERFKPLVRRLNSGATRGRYLAAKGSFPLQIVGLGAGLGGSYFAHQAGKNLKEKTVTKAYDGDIAKVERETTIGALIGAGAGLAVPRLGLLAGTAVGAGTGALAAHRRQTAPAPKRPAKKKVVAKSLEDIAKDAQAFRYDKKTGQRRRNANTNPTPGQATAQAAVGMGGGLAGMHYGLKGLDKAPQAAGKVNAAATKRVLNGQMGVKTGMKTVKAANKIRSLAQHGNAPIAALIGGAAAGSYAGARATSAFQNRNTTTKKIAKNQGTLVSAPDVDELFAKARKQYEASTAATIGGGVAGGAGSAVAAGGLQIAGAKKMNQAIVGPHTQASVGNREMQRTTKKLVGQSTKLTRAGRALAKPRSAALAAGLGATAGIAATLHEKKVAKAISVDTAEEVFAKFERETKRAAKKGAIGAGYIGGTIGLARGVAAGGHLYGAKGAVIGGVSNGIRGAVKWGALGGGAGAAVGASQAADRKKAKNGARR